MKSSRIARVASLLLQSRPLWSVMIPIYRPNICMLRENISSVLAASSISEQMQIALVQDGSECDPDPGLEEFLTECRDQGLEAFRYPTLGGIASNWNRCLQLSRGHLIHILHQDDKVRPGFYEAHETALRAESKAGASFTQHAFISATGEVLREGHLHRDQAGLLDDWFEYVVANLAIQCPAMVVRRSVYEHLGGFDESYRYCVDREMWQRIAFSYPIWFDPRTLAEHRVHAGSASSRLSVSILPWRETKRCIDTAIERIPPTARAFVERSAYCHLIRLARREFTKAVEERRWRQASASLMGLLSIGQLRALHNVFFAGRHPRAPLPRAPWPDVAALRNRKRVLLLTEFFPADGERSVFGVYSRLGRILEALAVAGDVDVVFFWPVNREPTGNERTEWERTVRSLWKISGSVRFVAAGRHGNTVDQLSDMIWALQGALSFLEDRPLMRTSNSVSLMTLRHLLAELQPDLIFAHRLGSAAPLLRIRTPMPPIIVDIDDLDHVKLARFAVVTQNRAHKLKIMAWAAIAAYATRQVCRLADYSLVTSDLDRVRLKRVCPIANVLIIPHSAEALPIAQQTSEPVAVFVGTFAYPPNWEGILWLVARVWPTIRNVIPDARLVIVGSGSERLGITSQPLGIEVLGFVADLEPIYRVARLAVCPIHRGAGTRIKIIEAAMNARAVVSTELGAEGLMFEPETEILLASGADQFAAACISLLRDPIRAARIGQAARRRAEAIHNPALILERLAGTFLDAMQVRKHVDVEVKTVIAH